MPTSPLLVSVAESLLGLTLPKPLRLHSRSFLRPHGRRRRRRLRREGPLAGAAGATDAGVVACRRLALATAGAVTHLLLVKAVGDAVLWLCLASASILAASAAALHLERVACGYDCAVVLAAVKVGALSAMSFTILWSPAMLVFIHRVVAAGADANDEEVRVLRNLAPFFTQFHFFTVTGH
jgi:hypothetical protein